MHFYSYLLPTIEADNSLLIFHLNNSKHLDKKYRNQKKSLKRIDADYSLTMRD